MRKCLCLYLATLALWAVAEKQPLSRYQSIIDRQMFGALPPGFDPTKSPSEVARTSAAAQKELTQEQAKLQSAVHFSVINVTPEGETAVGFTDNSDPKAPKHYYLKVGEVRDGWLVKEADPTEASMTIEKDEIEVTLKIGDNSAKGGGTTAKAGAPAALGMRTPFGGGLRREGGLSSLRSRRQLRQQQEQAAQDAAAKAAEQKEAERAEREAAEKAEREAERAQQRQQLLAIQEELRRAREEKQQAAEQKKAETAEGEGGDGNNAQ